MGMLPPIAIVTSDAESHCFCQAAELWRFRKSCHATGAIDALKLLDKYIAPGCVLLFDDLVNYPNYRDHEILALWEWLVDTDRKLEVSSSTVHARQACSWM